MTAPTPRQSPAGIIYAGAAFLAWGLLPIYWKLLGEVPPFQVMLNRLVWSLVFLVGLLTCRKRWPEVREVCAQRRVLLTLCCTSLLISSNWLIYIWAVNNDFIVESSLGYYINPLITVLLGVIILKERPNRWQVLAISLAFIAVLFTVIRVGTVPWIALSLAITFALYGLLRKMVPVQPLVGLCVETALLSPFALGFLFWFGRKGKLAFGASLSTDLLLVGAGVVTALPLIWFASATRRLRLSTMGFLQYLAPSCQLIIGVQVYKEPFTIEQQIPFGFIWIALLIFSTDALRRQRHTQPPPPSVQKS